MTRTTLLAALLAAALPATVTATELSFEITGIESADGHVLVALYDEATFLRKPVKAFRLAPGKVLSGSFGDVPPGLYAVSVVHDENGNGRLDMNAVGMPIERYGFSNNPLLMGAPRFVDARIEVNGATLAVQIALR